MVNIEIKHYSLVVMHDQSFQQRYIHQIDRLRKIEKVYCPRLSFNTRYLVGEDNLGEFFPPKEVTASDYGCEINLNA